MNIAPLFSKIARSFDRRKPGPLDAAETERQRVLHQDISELPSLENEKAESAAAADWLGYRRRVRQHCSSDDTREFLKWPVIQDTMFVGSYDYVRAEAKELRASDEWNSRWKQAIVEDAAGCPPHCHWQWNSSGNLVHHAYHLMRAEKLLGRKIETYPRIIEFGGGYGSFARLAWRMGFRGQYVIFDLPEFSALQRYFLTSVGVPLAGNGFGAGARCISDFNELASLATPGDGLFLALWSISETPVDFRRQVLTTVDGLSDMVIGYQDGFKEVDNARFFSDWVTSHAAAKWTTSPMGHLPGNSYLIRSSNAAD